MADGEAGTTHAAILLHYRASHDHMQPDTKWTSPSYWSLMFGNPTPPDLY